MRASCFREGRGRWLAIASFFACLGVAAAEAETSAAPETLTLEGDGDIIDVPQLEGVDIRVDGRLDEAVWQRAATHERMIVVEPDTLVATRHRTLARYLYTDQGLYVGVWNEQPPETLIARLSSRDENINRDSWGITIDTSGEGLYGYWFSVGLGGSIMDGKILPERNFSFEWDGPWQSATVVLEDGWSLEMFLPWSMMTMPQGAGKRHMGTWVNRKVAYVDERWSWPALPMTGARFMSALHPISLSNVEPKQQLSAFPYASVAADSAREDERVRVGTDLFWRPNPGLQVTGAILPDFGAVESDDVVVNLTAQETFFPEKRLFFLEGNEIFITTGRAGRGQGPSTINTSFGGGGRRTSSTFRGAPSTALNTRRIGGAALVEIPDDVDMPDVEISKPTDLLGAVKLTGQNGGLRFGMLGAVEDDPELEGTKDGEPFVLEGIGRYFAVGRMLFERAKQGRQSIGYMGTVVDHPLLDARVHGVDAQMLSPDGRLQVELQTLASVVTDQTADDTDQVTGSGAWMDIRYTPRRGVSHRLSLDYFGESLDVNDLGFLERNDLYGGNYGISIIRPGAFGLRTFATGGTISHWLNFEDRNVRTGLFMFNNLTFNNFNEVRTTIAYFPKRWDDLETRGNGSFRIHDRLFYDFGFGTDTSKRLSWSIQGGLLQESLGGNTYSAGTGITFKPFHRFSLDMDINYRYRDGWLLYQEDLGLATRLATFKGSTWQPRMAVDLFISARQQLRLTMQWAGIRVQGQQSWYLPRGATVLEPGLTGDEAAALGLARDDFTISRLTAQFRYRWEIAPLSDLFVVYTRGSNLPDRMHDSYGNLFQDALTDPIVDILVVKLRYRFGR